MKRIKTKTILLAVCMLLLLLFTANTALSDGWFSARVELEVSPSRSANNQFLSIGSIGDTTTLSCHNKPERLSLDSDLTNQLLDLASAGSYKEAEDVFKESVATLALAKDNDDSETNEYGYYAYRVTYELEYKNDDANALNAFIRLKPGSNYANAIVPGIFALQMLNYKDERGNLNELERLNIKNQGSAYYYPQELSPNEKVELEYTVFLHLSAMRDLDFDNLFSLDVIQVDNNASAVLWNVKIVDKEVTVYDKALLNDISYCRFSIDFEWTMEELEELEELLAENDLMFENVFVNELLVDEEMVEDEELLEEEIVLEEEIFMVEEENLIEEVLEEETVEEVLEEENVEELLTEAQSIIEVIETYTKDSSELNEHNNENNNSADPDTDGGIDKDSAGAMADDDDDNDLAFSASGAAPFAEFPEEENNSSSDYFLEIAEIDYNGFFSIKVC
ncbi:MAG: hypothetical protein FWG61_01945 [Firmicutes bacterium]|nr:hypothetical protein [Bacillota bacterium]